MHTPRHGYNGMALFRSCTAMVHLDNNQKSIAELKRLGTELRIRAPGQHARTAEARQSMLRHVVHMIEEDLKRHDCQIQFCCLYAEALFVVNAFSFYKGVSPYNAHAGRQPAFLPDLETSIFPRKERGLMDSENKESGKQALRPLPNPPQSPRSTEP